MIISHICYNLKSKKTKLVINYRAYVKRKQNNKSEI